MKRSARINLLKSINKQADFSIYDTIIKSISSLVDLNNPVTSILNLLAQGVIFSYFGWTGAILAVFLDKAFGINVTSLCSTIKDYVIPFITGNAGKPTNVAAEAEKMTSQVLSKLNVKSTDANKTLDQVQQENPDVKTALAQFQIKKEGVAGAIVGAMARWSLWGIVKSIIIALLTGAGFSMAGEATKQIVQNVNSPGSSKPDPLVPDKPPKDVKETPIDPEKSILKYVGAPSNDSAIIKQHPNTADKDGKDGDIFYIQSSGEFIPMLYNIVTQTYPNMSPKVKSIITNKFQTIAVPIMNEFVKWNNEDIEKPGTYVRVPPRIDGIVLDSFKKIADMVLSRFAIRQ